MIATVQADVSTAPGIELVINRAVDAFGGLDILVNNVGRAGGADLLGTTDAEWQAAFDETLFPAIRASRLAVPHMKQRGGGVDHHDRVDLGPRVRRPHDLQRGQGGRDQPGQGARAAARAGATSASTASRPDRSCSPAARGRSASRPIPRASPTSIKRELPFGRFGRAEEVGARRRVPRLAARQLGHRRVRSPSTAAQGRSNI